jgi:hypothetical protein
MSEVLEGASVSGRTNKTAQQMWGCVDARREVEGDDLTQEQHNTINGTLIVLYLEEFRSKVGRRSVDDQ